VDEASVNAIVEYVVKKDAPSLIDSIDKLVRQGKDLGIFLNALTEHLRALLLAKVSMNSFKRIVELSPSSKEFLTKHAVSITLSDILKVIDLLIEAKDLSRKLNSLRVPFELALIKFCHKVTEETHTTNSLPAKKSLDKGMTNHTQKKTNPADLDDDFDIDMTEEIDIEEGGSDPQNQNQPTQDTSGALNITLADIHGRWKEILKGISQKKVSLSSYLSEASLYSLEGRILKIAFPTRHSFHKEILARAANTQFIEGAIAQHIGLDVGVKFILSDGVVSAQQEQENEEAQDPEADRAPREEEAQKYRAREEESSFLNELMDTFEGRIHRDET